ncbi:MAG TPA: hypothetical protein VI072_19695 [Polyangiaceae bacterium]
MTSITPGVADTYANRSRQWGNANTPPGPSPAAQQMIDELRAVQSTMARAAQALGAVADKLRMLAAGKAL